MNRPKFWPEVAAALDEFNESARAALAIGPQMRPGEAVRFPWPTWAPAPGTWVRQAHQGARDRVLRSETWHIADGLLFEHEADRFALKPLCGREIRIEIDGRARVDGCRRSTFDVRGEPSPADRERWHCLRKRATFDHFAPGRLHRPWGDLGAREFDRRSPLQAPR